MSAHLRRRLAELGLKSLPKILTLQDRNPHSPTYGCFDRNFWHLRLTDFPSGMAQEFVLPLALAYANPFEGNPFHHIPTVREWIRAGIDYAALSAHSDGSTDDYYPFERAAGAAAFSLYAMVEALPLAELDPRPFLPFLTRRANWLAGHEESGRLSNHEALIANGVRSRMLGDATPDTGCGLKLFRRDVFLTLPAFDHMHRFLPALVQRAGFRAVSLPVSHRPRLHGVSKYGVHNRLWVGIVDLFGVMWLRARARPGLRVSEE